MLLLPLRVSQHRRLDVVRVLSASPTELVINSVGMQRQASTSRGLCKGVRVSSVEQDMTVDRFSRCCRQLCTKQALTVAESSEGQFSAQGIVIFCAKVTFLPEIKMSAFLLASHTRQLLSEVKSHKKLLETQPLPFGDALDANGPDIGFVRV